MEKESISRCEYYITIDTLVPEVSLKRYGTLYKALKPHNTSRQLSELV
jgi:hypothetical protein